MVGVRGSCRATSFRSMSGMCAYVAWWLAPRLETTGNGRAAATCDFACQLKRCNYTAHIFGVREFSRTPSTHMNSLGVCVSASLRMWLVGGQSQLCLHRGRSPWLPRISYFLEATIYAHALAVPHPTPDAVTLLVMPLRVAMVTARLSSGALLAVGPATCLIILCWVPWLRP